jgi:putative DNA-invertase from lambdoid prophage Rac
MGRAMFTLCAVISELEREIIRERVQAGIDRARRQGKQLGRPQRKLDLRAAKLLLEEGHSVRQVADVLGLPRTTLRRHLAAA